MGGSLRSDSTGKFATKLKPGTEVSTRKFWRVCDTSSSITTLLSASPSSRMPASTPRVKRPRTKAMANRKSKPVRKTAGKSIAAHRIDPLHCDFEVTHAEKVGESAAEQGADACAEAGC